MCGEPVVTWGAGATEGLNSQIHLGKLHQLQTWSSIPLSTLTFSTSSVEGWLPRSGNSFGGRDFLPSSSGWTPSYWTQPICSSAEYRLHLCRKPGRPLGHPSSYRTIRFGWKTNSEPALNRTVEGVPIRSRQYGWKLKYYAQNNLRSSIPSSLDLLARWAIAALGWDFGAVDVIKTREGKYVLIEANSAPSLRDEETCAAYAAAIKERLDA